MRASDRPWIPGTPEADRLIGGVRPVVDEGDVLDLLAFHVGSVAHSRHEVARSGSSGRARSYDRDMRPGYVKPLLCLAAAALLWYWAFVRDESVPFLQYADIAIHEVGHQLWRPFGTTPMFLGGNGTETLVPFLCALGFAWRRDLAASGLCLAWAAETMQNASVYIADAPYEALQLIGGEHDWAYLMDHWGSMARAEAIAAQVRDAGLCLGLAGMLVVAASAWLVHRERAVTTGTAILADAGDPFVPRADDGMSPLGRRPRRRIMR